MIALRSRFMLAFSFCLLFPAYSYADTAKASAAVDILPAHNATGAPSFSDNEATHPPLRVTPDKSELITLDRDAASIIIGNPQHANVIADSVRTLVVVPRAPGATYFTVLDKDGKVIMQRHVIVASPKDGYVRVKRTCNAESGDGCQNTSVFYCPDMCHEIGSQTEKDSSSDASSEESSDPAASMSKAGDDVTSEGTKE